MADERRHDANRAFASPFDWRPRQDAIRRSSPRWSSRLPRVPAFAGRAVLQDLFFVFTMLALAQYWNLLAGYAGLVSIGQQAFIGLGAYALFAATLIGESRSADRHPDRRRGRGGARPADRARRLPAARRIFRHRHMGRGGGLPPDPRAGESSSAAAPAPRSGRTSPTRWPASTGSARLFGVRISAARDIANYWLALALLVGTLALVFLLLRSRRGLALAAIRDSESAADSLGVDSFRTKLVVYVLTAFGTGMIGALIYLQKARISPDAAFSVLDWTAYVIFIVVIGGIGTIEGPIIGAIVLYLHAELPRDVRPLVSDDARRARDPVMLVAPGGLWGFVAQRFDLQIFPVRRRLKVRSD